MRAALVIEAPEVGRFRLTTFPVARCLLQPAEIDIRNVAAQPSVIDELCPRHRIISLTGAEPGFAGLGHSSN